MDRQIKDRDYLKMADLAYLPFKDDDKREKNIAKVFENRPDIKREPTVMETLMMMRKKSGHIFFRKH